MAQGLSKADAEKLQGPGPVPITLNVNGKTLKLEVEPRVTLLDALRNHSALTGAKEVCDRATCGACTVLLDDTPIYSCSKLAIEAQGHAITTVEGLAKDGQLTPVQQAFVAGGRAHVRLLHAGVRDERDGAAEEESAPDRGGSQDACAGNLCRCGTYPRVMKAALKAAGVSTASKTEVISYAKLA